MPAVYVHKPVEAACCNPAKITVALLPAHYTFLMSLLKTLSGHLAYRDRWRETCCQAAFSWLLIFHNVNRFVVMLRRRPLCEEEFIHKGLATAPMIILPSLFYTNAQTNRQAVCKFTVPSIGSMIHLYSDSWLFGRLLILRWYVMARKLSLIMPIITASTFVIGFGYQVCLRLLCVAVITSGWLKYAGALLPPRWLLLSGFFNGQR